MASSRGGAPRTYFVGEIVPLSMRYYDAYGVPAAPSGGVSIRLQLPDGTFTDLVASTTVVGLYTNDYTATIGGVHVATFTATGDITATGLATFVVVAGGLTYVPLDELKEYLGDISATDQEIARALTAEQYAQAARCDIKSYPPDLVEALKRRVARNLAARAVPISTFTSFEGGGTSARVPSSDAEVRRLEAPYLKWVLA